MSKRDIKISIYKYFAGLLIMACHFYRLGLGGGYPLYGAYIYVEFFFLLTGYYTAKHFTAEAFEPVSLDQAMGRALSYTWSKFSRYLPFSTVAVLAEYIVEASLHMDQGKAAFVRGLAGFPMEIFMFTSALPYSPEYPKLAPIWYLSAAFIVFPLFGTIMQQKQRKILLYIEAAVPLLYYGYFGLYGIRTYPHDLLRAFSGMLLGGLVFDMTESIRGRYPVKKVGLLRAAEMVCFLLPLLCAFFNESFGGLPLVCFAAGLSIHFILMDGSSSKAAINKAADRLERQSLLIFLNHWVVATWIGSYGTGLHMDLRIFFYYAVTIMIAMAEDAAAVRIRKFIVRAGERRS